MDLKIATLFTLVTVLLPIVAALLAAEHGRLIGWQGAAAILAAFLDTGAWISIVRILYLAYLPNQWEIGPKWPEFQAAAQTHSERSVYLANAHFIVADSIPRNENLLRRKAHRLSVAMRLFPLELLLFAFSVTVSLF